MKRMALFLLIAILLADLPALSQRVSVSGTHLSLEQVFTEIRKQTGLEFFYPSALLKMAHPVTLNMQQMPVHEVLKSCLQGQGLGFNIRSGTIIIFKEEEPASTGEPVTDRPLPADTVVMIKGRVVDGRGQPVEMASVVLARTRAGTHTDRWGAFTLKVKKLLPADSLHISFIGFKDHQLRINGKTDLDQVMMLPADNVLDEAMVIAYGTTSERFRIGDITTVKAAQIESTPTLNVIEALAGRVPGLYIRQNGSNPGSIYNIQLRGVNVIPQTEDMAKGDAVNMLSKPLIVIDGLPLPPDVVNSVGSNLGVDAMTGFTGAGGGQDPLYWLNSFDVESITVLKDAEATALYGSRAANGVIIMATKKGKPGKTALNINFNTGINAPARRLKLLNTQQYLAMRHEAWNNTIRAGLPVAGGLTPSYTPTAANAYDLLVWDTTRYTDWQKVLLSSAPVYNVNLELSGGEGSTNYRMSTGYNRSGSSYPGVRGKPPFGEEKGTLSLSVATRSFNNRFKWVSSMIASLTASLQPTGNPDNAVLLAPNAPGIFDAAGNINYVDWRAVFPIPGIITTNPLSFLAASYRSNRFTMMTSTNLSYELLPSLVFTIGAGYARTDGKVVRKTPGTAADPLVTPSRIAGFGNSSGAGFNIEPNLRYEVRWKRHYLNMLAGGSFQSDRQEGGLVLASGYTSDALMGSPTGAASYSFSNNFMQRNSVSALARASYRYADALLVDLSARRDGSSSFGPGRRFGNFGSIGLGWIFTRLPWFKKVPLLTFGKIRGSYGLTGSQNADPYAYQSTFAPSLSGIGTAIPVYMPNYNPYARNYGSYQNVSTFTIRRTANSTLGWAQALCLDLGIDLYLLADQRLKLSAQWYRRRTGDQLVVNPVSVITGASTYLLNLPAEVENSGVEVMLDYTAPKRRSPVGWFLQLNIAANSNKLLSFPGLENSPFKKYYEIGQPIIWQQLYPSFLDKKTGTYTLSDTSHPVPVPYRVSNYPAFTGGMQMGVSYKGLSLSLSFMFARQKGFINIQGALQPGLLLNLGQSNQSVSVIQDRRWQSPADSTIGGALHAALLDYDSQLDLYWGDASYIALKNATLNYTLPRTLLKKVGLSGLSFYIRGENLLLLPLSAYKGFNPEQPDHLSQLPLRLILVSGFTINL